MQFPFKIMLNSENDTLLAASEFANVLNNGDIVALNGDLGTGKTFFVKGVAKEYKIYNVNSPTFAIVYEYTGSKRIYHFDFYRIKSEKEAFDIGTEEYFYSGNYSFVEWPEKIPSLLPDNFAEIKITVENDTQRTIEISIHG